jgi:hypothetical protein
MKFQERKPGEIEFKLLASLSQSPVFHIELRDRPRGGKGEENDLSEKYDKGGGLSPCSFSGLVDGKRIGGRAQSWRHVECNKRLKMANFEPSCSIRLGNRYSRLANLRRLAACR